MNEGQSQVTKAEGPQELTVVVPEVLRPELELSDLADRDEEVQDLLYCLNPNRACSGFLDSWTYADIVAEGWAFTRIRDVLIENLRREIAVQHEFRDLESAKRSRVLQAMRDAVAYHELQARLTSRELPELQLEVEQAKAKAEIAEYKQRARPQRETTAQEDRTTPKERILRDIERLKYEEIVEVVKLTGGKPESEWSEAVKEEVMRTQNMYENARERKRRKLAEVL